MHETKNDLPLESRKRIVGILNARLAEAIDLMLQGKQAHWNVKGPSFIALHELFDKLVEENEEWVDDLAERAISLGGTAYGTLNAVRNASALPEYPTDIHDGLEHVRALSTSYAAFAKSTRAAIGETDKLGDDVTSDLFTSITKSVDKSLWFLEAHVQGKR